MRYRFSKNYCQNRGNRDRCVLQTMIRLNENQMKPQNMQNGQSIGCQKSSNSVLEPKRKPIGLSQIDESSEYAPTDDENENDYDGYDRYALQKRKKKMSRKGRNKKGKNC